jgi:protein TonB
LAISVALGLELGGFTLIWVERGYAPAPPPEEIPVEIVVEPPPPPPPPEAKAEPQPQEYEKPATDAPREGKSDHDDENVAEKEKPAAAPPPPVATPSPEASKPAEAPAPDLPKEAEAEAPPPVKAEPQSAPPPKPSAVAALMKNFQDVPDVDFGGVAVQSPVTGGAAKASYLTMLYGLVIPRMRVPALAHAYGRRLSGVVAFAVDGRGRLMQRYVVESSGSMELDEAAMQAVSDASRAFPPPPHKAPIGMRFTYSVD